MSSTAYTVLGWIVWQVASRVAKRKAAQNKPKLIAGGVVLAVLVGGVVAARSGSDD